MRYEWKEGFCLVCAGLAGWEELRAWLGFFEECFAWIWYWDGFGLRYVTAWFVYVPL